MSDYVAAQEAELATLVDLRFAVHTVRTAEESLADAVAASRARGISWARIGLVVGLTREAARRRWSA